ncbi:MAG: DUF1294 domain-containing protein [Ruminococcus sp.]|nr:DUF1294 domain-containing protein [Ruminococcus sp.]
MIINFLIAYLIIINIIAVIVTALDKFKAIHHQWRISEAALLIVSALGGGAAMYTTMLIIRHKTHKLKFMLGIPLIIAVELFAILWVINYVI